MVITRRHKTIFASLATALVAFAIGTIVFATSYLVQLVSRHGFQFEQMAIEHLRSDSDRKGDYEQCLHLFQSHVPIAKTRQNSSVDFGLKRRNFHPRTEIRARLSDAVSAGIQLQTPRRPGAGDRQAGEIARGRKSASDPAWGHWLWQNVHRRQCDPRD